MSVQDFEARLGRAPDVFVHIGAGDGSHVDLAERAGRAILVEPDPMRFKLLELACEHAEAVSVRQVALAPASGRAQFFSQSLRRFGSTRPVTGARQLFRGLQPAGEYKVQTATLGELVGELKSVESLAIIIDAPSEVLIALEQIEAAGWLERPVAIQIKLADLALHEGGADRASVEAWIKAKGFGVTPVARRSDPDIWSVWIDLPKAKAESAGEEAKAEESPSEDGSEDAGETEPDTGALVSYEAQLDAVSEKLTRLESRYAVLEERYESQGKLVQKHRSKAYRLGKQLEKSDAVREKLDHSVAKLEAKLEEEVKARSEQSARYREQLYESERAAKEARRASEEASAKEIKALQAERDGAIERSRKVEGRLKALDETLARRGRDEQTLIERCEALSEQLQSERQKYAEQASQGRKVSSELAEHKAKLKSVEEEKSGLASRLEQTRANAEETRKQLDTERKARAEAEARAKALEAEVKLAREASDATRDDLALTVRTQNMAQSDLQELQDRFQALAEEKRSLEELLGKLMDRLYDASERVEALSWAEAAAESSTGGAKES